MPCCLHAANTTIYNEVNPLFCKIKEKKMEKKFITVSMLTALITVPWFATADDEVYLPEPLAVQLSADGDTLINGMSTKALVLDPTPAASPRRIPAPINLAMAQQTATASFDITYIANGGTDKWGEPCFTFPEEAKTALEAATSIWANVIKSEVPITIHACWADLASSSTLGYAGGGTLKANFTGAIRSDTYYVASLANALAGLDLDTDNADIHSTYNQNFDWYFGTDGNTPSDKVDMITAVIHEIAHGLNFSGSMQYSGGTASWGYGGSYPNIYDVFVQDISGNDLIDTNTYPSPSTALGAALTSGNLWFHGANAIAANDGQPVKLYAPSTWAPGSSYSHLNYDDFNDTSNELMVYAVSFGEAIHDPGAITKGLFQDLGWGVDEPSDVDVSPLINSIPVTGSVGPQEWKKYKITASSTDIELQVNLSDLSADLDLYIKQGSEPTLYSYDCRPYLEGIISESCTLVNSGETEWYISVYGYRAGNFNLEAILLESDPVTPLISGEQVIDAAVEVHQWRHYMITASSSDTQLQVDLSSLSNDLDLYVRQGAAPTLTSYDCRPYFGSTSSENCELSNSGETEWYIGVYGYQAGSFDLEAVLSGSNPAIPLTSGETNTHAVGYNTWENYIITSSSTDTQLKVDLSNLSADLDLYVKKDAMPTRSSYDCRPYRGATHPETCNLNNNGETTWYISVHGYQAGSFDLQAVLSGLDTTVTTLTSGETVSDAAGNRLWK
ncbi:MAG: hypothetical protein D3923_06215, partial [Candidatus Electrothrix sp. AR3]|nr:hypothetical protein [Candidatus Electrothrix sp. AR3]